MGLMRLFKSAPSFSLTVALALAAVTLASGCDKKNDNNNNNGYVQGYAGGGGFGPTQACMTPYQQTNQADFTQRWQPFQQERIRPYSWSRSQWGGGQNDRRSDSRECRHSRRDHDDRYSDRNDRDSDRGDRDSDRDDSRYGNEELHRLARVGLGHTDPDAEDQRRDHDDADRPNRRPRPDHDHDEDCDDATDIGAPQFPGDGGGVPPIVGGYPNGGGYQNGGGIQNQQFCGCQNIPNTVPACGPQGMTCVPVQRSYSYAGWGYANNQFNPIQNQSFQMNNGCQSQVAQICTPIGSVNGNYICQNVNGAQYGQGQYGVWILAR